MSDWHGGGLEITEPAQSAEDVRLSISLAEVEEMIAWTDRALHGGSPVDAFRAIRRILIRLHKGTTPVRIDGPVKNPQERTDGD